MNYFRSFFLICVFLLIEPNTLLSQSLNRISGIVYDDETNKPLDRVNIVLDHTQIGTSTNSSGLFSIDNLGKGNYSLKVSHVGYKDLEKVISVPQIDGMLEIRLTKSFYNQDQIMVTGLYVERPLAESPIITEVINHNDIQRYSASTVLEILEKVIPNIQITTDSHGTTMNIQGLDSKYFLFLLNGNRITGETTGNIDFSRLNTTNIERIEMLNGGAATSYGSGAIGGVINIITKQNLSPYSINFGSKLYSENNDYKYWATLSLNNKYFNSSTELNKKTSDGYGINRLVIQNTYNDLSITQNVKFNFLNNIKFDISGRYYVHDTEDYNYVNKKRDKYYDKQLVFNSTYNSQNDKYRLNLHWNNDVYDKFTVLEEMDDQERMRSSHRLNLVNSNLLYQLNDNLQFLLGSEYYDEEFFSPYDLSINAGYLGEDTLKNSDITSIYFQTNYNYNKNFHLVTGIRYDNSKLFGTHLGPHISILYKKDKHNFRFNSSNNFKSPTLKEMYMSWDHLGMFYINGSENLKPETSKYFSFSYEYLTYQYNITLKPYIHMLQNMIYSIQEFENDQMIYKNFKSVNISGLDLYFKIKTKFIYYSTTWSFINPLDKTEKRQLEGTNKMSVNNNLSVLLFNNKQNLNFNYKYVSETFYLDNNSVPKYHVLNLSYNISNIDFMNISLGIDNLINTSELDSRKTIYPNTRYFMNINFEFN